MRQHDESINRDKTVSRRRFAAIGAATLAATQLAPRGTQAAEPAGDAVLKPGAVILFQGDSITDAGRSREAADKPNSQPALGDGYAWLAASQLLVDYPENGWKIFNRGISGNKVPDLAARWQADCINLKPDVLSVLIGVNDIWHKLNGNYEGTAEKYETEYHALVKRTQETLPQVKLIVCEPFVLRCGAVDEKWFPQFDEYRAAAKRVAEQSGALFVPFQTVFDEASKVAPHERWAGDGVHPSGDGAALMAHAWRRIVDGA